MKAKSPLDNLCNNHSEWEPFNQSRVCKQFLYESLLNVQTLTKLLSHPASSHTSKARSEIDVASTLLSWKPTLPLHTLCFCILLLHTGGIIPSLNMFRPCGACQGGGYVAVVKLAQLSLAVYQMSYLQQHLSFFCHTPRHAVVPLISQPLFRN